MEATQRRLIRPSLNELKERIEAKKGLTPPIKTPPPQAKEPAAQQHQQQKKPSGPAESTNAENFYYAKQISNKTPMVFVLKDGEQLHGIIDWYDKACLRIARTDHPTVMVYKQNIKYMYKSD
jgi:sRNA-binding regulator protein Hfq